MSDLFATGKLENWAGVKTSKALTHSLPLVSASRLNPSMSHALREQGI